MSLPHLMKQYKTFLVPLLFCGLFVIVCTSIFYAETPVHAIDIGQKRVETLANQSGFEAATKTTLAANIGKVISIALSMVGTIFLMITVYAGIIWMTARGDESKAESSQKMLRNALIGLIITLGAYSITAFVLPQIISRSTTGTGGQMCGSGSAEGCRDKPIGTSCGGGTSCRLTNQTGICSCN